MTMTWSRQSSTVKVQLFGVRKDGCSCDPCDCNPCECGDNLVPNVPSWRISGFFVQSGSYHDQSLSEELLLSLAQPEQEGSREGWHEVLLVGKDLSLEQIHALLLIGEADLESMPAEVEALPRTTRSVYRASMEYQMTEKGPHLRVSFSPESANIVRKGSRQHTVRAWTYDGAVHIRGNVHLASS